MKLVVASVFIIVIAFSSTETVMAQISNPETTPLSINSIKFENPRIIDVNGTLLSMAKTNQQIRIELDLINQTRDMAAFELLYVNDTNSQVFDTNARIPISANQTVLISPPFVLTTPGTYVAKISLCEILPESQLPRCINGPPIPISSIKITVDSVGYVVPDPSRPICAYSVDGDAWINIDSCHDRTPTVLSQSSGLSPADFQHLMDYDKKLYELYVIHSECRGCSDSFLSQFCSYDNNGNLIPGFSDIQKKVLTDLNKNYSVYVCPFEGTATPQSRLPSSPNIVTSYPVTTPISPTCQAGEALLDNLYVTKETICPISFNLQNGICVATTESCPSGYTIENGRCYSITENCDFGHCNVPAVPLSCPQGSIALNGQCVLTTEVQPTPPLTCPNGFGFQDHTCVGLSSLPSEECPSGTLLQNNMCVLSNLDATASNSTFKQNPNSGQSPISQTSSSSQVSTSIDASTSSSRNTTIYSVKPQLAIEYLVEQRLVKAPNYNGNNINSVFVQMPSWIKNTVTMWKNGQISDEEFTGEIQYLTDHGIVKIFQKQ